jgi:hypothetical protein
VVKEISQSSLQKETIKLAHGGVLLLVSPSKLAVLQKNLFDPTSV